MDALETARQYWDADAATYDAPGNSTHTMRSPAERAAWAAGLARHLPPAPAEVLDVGAGTGFLTLVAARLGHRVTALDLSPAMLDRLARSAEHEGLDVTIVEGPATEPPDRGFDAVTTRHLLWTLPDPLAALRAWRAVAPGGRLLAVESMWGGGDAVEQLRGRARHLLHRTLRRPSGHHAPYPAELRAALPHGGGTSPAVVVELLESAGWKGVRIERLRDVEWVRGLALPPLERLFGVVPEYVVRGD